MTGPRGGRTKPQGRHAVRTCWQKATRYREAAKANLDAGHFDPATSNAVNACINLSDALAIHELGRQSRSGDHYDAVDLLNQIAQLGRAWAAPVANHLRAILQVKNLAQYEVALVTRVQAEAAVERMDRSFRHVEALVRGWMAEDSSAP